MVVYLKNSYLFVAIAIEVLVLVYDFLLISHIPYFFLCFSYWIGHKMSSAENEYYTGKYTSAVFSKKNGRIDKNTNWTQKSGNVKNIQKDQLK